MSRDTDNLLSASDHTNFAFNFAFTVTCKLKKILLITRASTKNVEKPEFKNGNGVYYPGANRPLTSSALAQDMSMRRKRSADGDVCYCMEARGRHEVIK